MSIIEETKAPRSLLLVDDEPNILSALKRTLRKDRYSILTADSAEEGLGLLMGNKVGVIISDQRMPYMNGIEFFRQVKTLYPKTIRIILSGYTDLESITSAINEGAVYKFLTKPWEDDLLRQNVLEAFAYYEIEQENQRLTLELQQAHDKLFLLNQNLAQQVQQKTREIVHNITMLEISQEILEHLPVAILGIDELDMIAATNRLAEKLLAGHCSSSLLGLNAGEALPEQLLQIVQQPPLAKNLECGNGVCNMADGTVLQVWVSLMGESSRSKGTIVVLSPVKEG